MSEADYLALEAADAKAALLDSLHDLKSGLISSADLRAWVKHYPWSALGAATAAGFAAAAAVTPAAGETVKDKLSRWMPSTEESTAADADGAVSRSEKPSKMSAISDKLINSLFDIAKILVQTLIVTTLRPPESPEPAEVATPEQRTTRMAR